MLNELSVEYVGEHTKINKRIERVATTVLWYFIGERSFGLTNHWSVCPLLWLLDYCVEDMLKCRISCLLLSDQCKVVLQ